MADNLENGTTGVTEETTETGLVINFSELTISDIKVYNTISEMYMNYPGYLFKKVFTDASEDVPAFYVAYKGNTADSPYAVCMLSNYATSVGAITLASEVGEGTPDETESQDDEGGTDSTDGTSGTEGTDGTDSTSGTEGTDGTDGTDGTYGTQGQ